MGLGLGLGLDLWIVVWCRKRLRRGGWDRFPTATIQQFHWFRSEETADRGEGQGNFAKKMKKYGWVGNRAGIGAFPAIQEVENQWGGRWAVGGGRWAVGGGRWAVGGGRRAVGGGRWAVAPLG